MTFLIDGYNLMHAVGLVRRGLPAKGLEPARIRFLDWLADSIRDRDDLLRVVFDAQKAPMPSSEYGHRGVRVRFAFRQTADEMIEELVQAEPHPSRLAVVSNDRQVQEAGRRRRCEIYTCQMFVDWTIDQRPANTPHPHEPEKPEPDATPEEMAAWLTVFSTPPKKRRRR